MEDQKSAPPTVTAQDILAALNIRTMEDDLKKAEGKFLPPAPLPTKAKTAVTSKPPVPKPPVPPKSPVGLTIPPTVPQTTKNIVAKPVSLPAPAPPIVQSGSGNKMLEQMFDQAQTALIRGNFEEAINLAQKISQDKDASWTLAFRAKKLIVDANEKREKTEKKPFSSASDQTKWQTKNLPEPPTYLPTGSLIIESDKISDLKLPIPPKASTPSLTSALPTQKITSVFPAQTPSPAPQQKTEKLFSPSSEPKITPPLSDKIVSQKATKRWLKLAIIGFIILILAGSGAYFYLNYWPLAKPICEQGQISQACQCNGQTLDTGFCCKGVWLDKDCSFAQPIEPIISSLNQRVAIDASVPEKTVANIKEASQGIEILGARLIDLKLTNSPVTYAKTLNQAEKALNIKLPSDVISNAETFNLVVYVKPTEGLPNDPNKEIRLAFIIKPKNTSQTQSVLAQWESTMVEDLKPMIIGAPGEPVTPDFQTALYHDGLFKYQNLPTSNLTIDYVVKNNLLIIATSKNSAFYVFDAATGASQ